MGDIDATGWVRPCQIMEWSNDASLALLEEYRKQPVLWDAKHQNYLSKSQKQEAWEAIAANMQLDVQEVKQKMNSLLGSFRREKSRIRKNRNSTGGQGTYSSRWFAFEKMQFLLRDEADFTVEPHQLKREDEEYIFEELNFATHDPVDTLQDDSLSLSMSGPPAKKPRKGLKQSPDLVLEDVPVFAAQDEFSAFGQYIACKLRKYNVKTKAFVQQAINNVLFEADLGKYDNASLPFETNE